MNASTHFRLEPTEAPALPFLVFYRTIFSTESESRLHFRYSADERCMIFLDGERIAEGPEIGTPDHWHYGVVERLLAPGDHCLVARVSSFAPFSPSAQMSIRHGFFFEEESHLVTGEWEHQVAAGITFLPSNVVWGTGPCAEVAPEFNWNAIRGKGGSWLPAVRVPDSRALYAQELPPMRRERIEGVHQDADGFHLPSYACVWAEYEFEGPGTVELRWFERATGGEAGNADRLTLPPGRVRWVDFKFRAGRRVELQFTGSASVTKAEFHRTGYPFSLQKSLAHPNPRREWLLRTAFHTLECCSVETYFDCPFYEQLQYVSDSRIEMHATLAVTGDERLPRKMLREYARGLFSYGALRDRFPSKDPEQEFQPGDHYVYLIPSFAALYLQMTHDFLLFHPDEELAGELLPAMRRIAGWLRNHRHPDHLYRELPGWNFIDWVPAWEYGVPTHCERGAGCTLNWIIVQSLRDLADIERAFGNSDDARMLEEEAEATRLAIHRAFYNSERGCFAEDEGHRTFSEHAQVFAALTENSREHFEVVTRQTLDHTSISFDFYYFEACARFDLPEIAEKRLERYYALADSGLDTLPEEFTKWRSCCHAWSSHSLYFEFRTRNLSDRIKR